MKSESQVLREVSAGAAPEAGGRLVERRFTRAGVHPFDEVEWERRDAVITSEAGSVVFEQRGVEMPSFWSQLATNVVVSKYFYGAFGTPERETSLRQVIDRVARTITGWGRQGGYFRDDEEAEIFYAELTRLLLHQKLAFNSPVWFNVGIEEKPQCSACFINSVEDSMESILGLARTEGMLFKWGSGTGTNLSTIRSSREKLAGGGVASGPVSFLRGYDAFAGVIKSGGKTRRAAKMVILNADHPDIEEFIDCKVKEEKKAWALIDMGYDGGFSVSGGAYDSVFFQNANHSVRATDEFMCAVERDDKWKTYSVVGRKAMDTLKARDLLSGIAEATHLCGDPGMQFDTTINDWNPCSDTARINASNPCSEYMFLDDTACNLASVNIMGFVDGEGNLDAEAFEHACHVSILAQEIIVDNALYPTPAVTQNSHEYRPLGLGYANLGAFLMSQGVPYDSDAGRAYCGAITALMTGAAYRASALIAARESLGPFPAYEKNRGSFLRVIRKHRDHVSSIERKYLPSYLYEAAERAWNDALETGEKYGFRNAQATVIAPTGTIAFMMDCDTTGIEPDIALVKYKKLVGGGMLKIVNNTVPLALKRLGYDDPQAKAVVDYIDQNDTIEGAPGLREEDLPVFDCAFKPTKGARSIHHMGHVRMMAAAQPFVSGAISKTVNMPQESTAGEIMDTYVEAWKLGLKSIAIYRDGSKRTQPLNTSLETKDKDGKTARVVWKPQRRRLPDTREAVTHKFSVGGHEGYITAGLYEDKTPGEIFVVMAKEGAVISGLIDTVATLTSIALQYGVPLEMLVNKFKNTRFEPSGITTNPDIPMATSVIDYIFKWLEKCFVPQEEDKVVEHPKATEQMREQYQKLGFEPQSDAPPCTECGGLMVRKGPCYFCLNCLHQTGGCS
ncbi:MAG: vitamin B12-dependent ribonucleotide reductase [Acidobacteriota bacterium]|nr:MAG: vitamin B12-dependent ribonucleotide reductase [Acidobacteriota bacterium]